MGVVSPAAPKVYTPAATSSDAAAIATQAAPEQTTGNASQAVTGDGTASQAVTGTTEKKKRGSKPKSDFVFAADAKDAAGKLIAVPKIGGADGLNPRKHKLPSESDFAKSEDWYEMRAQLLEAEAAKLRLESKGGSVVKDSSNKPKAKKLIQTQNRMNELIAELKAKGEDVTAILESIRKAAGN